VLVRVPYQSLLLQRHPLRRRLLLQCVPARAGAWGEGPVGLLCTQPFYPVCARLCLHGLCVRVGHAERCLNNCSPPNGECIDGTCLCKWNLNPYNRSRNWRRFEGHDCSFGRGCRAFA
jgi:hypothetical protein